MHLSPSEKPPQGAVQRIPDAKCNGDMHAALEYAQKVKHEQKDFLREQALENLHDVP